MHSSTCSAAAGVPAKHPPATANSRAGCWIASERSRLESPAVETFGQNLAKRLGPKRKERMGARMRRCRTILQGLKLHTTVIHRLCAMQFEALKRVSNFVESIRDNLMFSTPDCMSRPSHVKKVLSWAYSIGSYRTDSGVRQWKAFAALLKWHSFSSETPKPENPTDFPGFGEELEEDFSSFWLTLCPWLRTIVGEGGGSRSKLDLSRVGHLSSTRGFPPGDANTRRKALATHLSVLSQPPPLESGRPQLLRSLSRVLGNQLKEYVGSSAAHLSLTSSSSYDFPVKEGGRGAEIAVSFRQFLERVPTVTVEGETLLGKPYSKMCGFPVWMTMCRDNAMEFIQGLPHDEDGALQACVQAGESRQDTFFDFENFKYEDPLYALDNVTGYQMHQWATEELLARQILSGHENDPQSLRFTGEVLPLIRRSAIGEPGAKSRVVTVAEACLTIFLQPFSHHIMGILRTHPSATTGLTRAAQGFEYAKALHFKRVPEVDVNDLALKMLSSDLTTATDYCLHEYSQAMLEGFLEGIGQVTPYHTLATQLLCSGRVLVENGTRTETCRGILMGDPGSKAVLTMHNLCAEAEALVRFSSSDPDLSNQALTARVDKMQRIPGHWWRQFACAGDDHVAIGPESYLRLITASHSRNGMAVSWPQNFVSKIGAVYCEENLFIRDLGPREIFQGKPLWKLDYETHVHVDIIKLRLLSPCSKEHEGKDEPNPGIGKAYQLNRILNWLPDSLKPLRKWLSWRFHDRFAAHLPRSYHLHLQRSLGGVEAPAWHREVADLAEEYVNQVIPEHAFLIEKVLSGESTPMDRRVLSSFATNARARGIEQDAILDHVRDFLSNEELTKAITVEQLQTVIAVENDTFKDWNFRKKMAAASAAGFIPINDAINLIDRPYIFRDILYPDMSEKHGCNPRSSASYEPLPWGVRTTRFDRHVEIQVPSTEVTPLRADTALRLADSACTGSFLEVPSTGLLIPKSVVSVESRPTLQTPYRC